MSAEANLRTLDERKAFADAVRDTVESASHRIWIGSQRLEGLLYGSAEFTESLKRFVLAHSRNRVQILVRYPAEALREAPMLIALARRLRTQINVRQPNGPKHEFDAEWVLSDTGSHVFRRLPEDRQLTYATGALPETRRHITEFERLWDLSVPSPEMREMRI